ncbi:MAG: hypothetical protein M1821_008932 [Bathelium mastoideum]|nr:MAG: hypothetical protein M1821_008932 [Bathelium mastoideum]
MATAASSKRKRMLSPGIHPYSDPLPTTAQPSASRIKDVPSSPIPTPALDLAPEELAQRDHLLEALATARTAHATALNTRAQALARLPASFTPTPTSTSATSTTSSSPNPASLSSSNPDRDGVEQTLRHCRTTLDAYTRRLQVLNETRDVAMSLAGLVAEARGKRVREVLVGWGMGDETEGMGAKEDGIESKETKE